MIDSRIIGLIGSALLGMPAFKQLALTILINRQNKAFYPFFTMPGTRFTCAQRVNTFFQPTNKDTVNYKILYTDSINNTAPKLDLNLEFGHVLFEHELFKVFQKGLSEFTSYLDLAGLGSAPIIQSMQSMQETLYPGSEATWAIISYLGFFWDRVAFENAVFSFENRLDQGVLKNFNLQLSATYIKDVDLSQFYPIVGSPRG